MNRRGVILGAGGTALAAAVGYALLGDGEPQSRHVVGVLGEDSSNLQAITKHLNKVDRDRSFPNSIEGDEFSVASAKALQAFAQGASSPDIVLGYNFSLSPFVRNHYIYKLDELKRRGSRTIKYDFEEDIYPNVWKELGYYAEAPYDDLGVTEAIAYPSSANTMLLVYDRKVLGDAKVRSAYRSQYGREFAPPSTWEEFLAVSRLVKAARSDFFGVALQGSADSWLYYEWMNFLYGMGGTVMEKANGWQSDVSTPLTLRTVEAAKAAEAYISLKSLNAGDFFTTTAVRQRDIMLERKTAFAIMWTDYIPDLAKAGDFGFAPIPGPHSMIAGGSFFVNRRSPDPSAALALIAHLLSAPVQKELALTGLFPPTRSALEDPEVLAIPYMPAVKASLDRGIYMLEAGIDSSLINEKIGAALQQAWRGDIAPAQVGALATSEIVAGRRRLR